MGRLDEQQICWVATTRPDGRSHLTPIWFVWHDDRIWMCCSAGSVKARNLRANPAISFSLQDGADPLVAEGTATLHSRPFPAEVAAVFREVFDWDITEAEPGDPYDCLVEVSVTRWLMGNPDR